MPRLIQHVTTVLDRVWTEAAALSYAALFSLVPFVSLTLALLRYVIPDQVLFRSFRHLVRTYLQGTFEDSQVRIIIERVQAFIEQFYSWNFSFYSLLSFAVVLFVSTSLLAKLLKASFRAFDRPLPPLPERMKRMGIGFFSFLCILFLATLVPALKHAFHWKSASLGPLRIGVYLGQIALLSVLLRSLYPWATSLTKALQATVVGVVGFRLLTALFQWYATVSVSSRSVFGAWALFPVLLLWLFFNFLFLFACLGFLHFLTQRHRKKTHV